MDEKIIQISPAPAGMAVAWRDSDGQRTGEIVCLALVEDKDGARAVKPMVIHGANEIQLFPVPNTVSFTYTYAT